MAPPTGLFDLPTHNDTTSSLELLTAQRQYDRGESFLAWSRYINAERLYRAISDEDPNTDRRYLDDVAHTAARLAVTRRITKHASTTMLTEALATIYRIPQVAECLREGTISPREYQALVAHTDLIDGMPYAPDVDADLANELRRKQTWTEKRLKDTADRIIGRYDLDAMRRRRHAAKDHRDAWIKNLDDGMAQLAATASAEDITLAMAAITRLADSVCAQDPRTAAERRSDALICRAQGVDYTCQCGRPDCDATPDTTAVSETNMKIMVCVIAERSTLDNRPENDLPTPPPDDDETPDQDWPNHNDDDGDGGGGLWADSASPSTGPEPSGPADPSGPAGNAAEPDTEPEPEPVSNPEPATGGVSDTDPAPEPEPEADHEATTPTPPEDTPIAPDPRADGSQRPGFLHGYGVITADHVRDIANRPDTIIRHLNPNPDKPLPSCLPSDPYRFSAALATFIRARDGYCTFPGCTAPALSCEIDHTTEYDHANPAHGGQTTAANGKALCTFHHLIKTFGNWLDDQYVDADGYTHTVVTTPEGLTVHSHGQTNEDLLPALRTIRFTDPPITPPNTETTNTATTNTAPASDPPTQGPQRRRTRLADKLSTRRAERKKNRETRWADPHGIQDQPDF